MESIGGLHGGDNWQWTLRMGPTHVKREADPTNLTSSGKPGGDSRKGLPEGT